MFDSISLTYATQTRLYVEKPQSEYPKYAQVKNHVEMFGVNILDFTGCLPNEPGIPDVFQLKQTKDQQPVSLNLKLQKWMKGLFDECMDGIPESDIINAWHKTFRGMRAFTNKFGPDNGYADYIQGLNTDAEPMKLNPTICRGNVVKVLREAFYQGGVWISEIEVLDAFDPDTLTKTFKDNRHLIFCAVNWSRCYIDDKRTIDPRFFPHGRGEPFPNSGNRHVPIPLLGNRTTKGYIETQWLRFLDPAEPFPPSPYWR